MQLLLKHGGVYMDATTYLNRNVDWIEDWFHHRQVGEPGHSGFTGHAMSTDTIHNHFFAAVRPLFAAARPPL